MEVLWNEDDLSHEVLYKNEKVILKQEIKGMKNKLLSPVNGIIKKVDSNNTEIIIKSYKGDMLFLYLNERFINEPITSLVKEGDLVFKGEIILDISCGYIESDLTILKILN